MRNEFAEKFLPVLRGAREFTRDGKEVSAKREGGMKGKTGKRSVDRRGDQAKKTGKAARRSRLLREMRMVHRSAEEVSGGGQAEKGRQAHGMRNEIPLTGQPDVTGRHKPFHHFCQQAWSDSGVAPGQHDDHSSKAGVRS